MREIFRGGVGRCGWRMQWTLRRRNHLAISTAPGVTAEIMAWYGPLSVMVLLMAMNGPALPQSATMQVTVSVVPAPTVTRHVASVAHSAIGAARAPVASGATSPSPQQASAAVDAAKGPITRWIGFKQN
jgi:hypothetical protein